MIAEKNILACQDGQITFRYLDSQTKRWKTRALPGADFLWLLLRHVLPRRFRRARNFGFLHPNSKRLMALVQLLLKVDLSAAQAYFKPRPTLACTECGGVMKVIHTRLAPARTRRDRPPDGIRTVLFGFDTLKTAPCARLFRQVVDSVGSFVGKPQGQTHPTQTWLTNWTSIHGPADPRAWTIPSNE